MSIFYKSKKIIAVQIAIIFFIILDRFLKVLALEGAARPCHLIGEILRYNFKANYYIAFSLPLAGRPLMVLLAIIIFGLMALAVFYWFKREPDKLAPLSLIILGASSNLFDRLRYGFVVDYLDLKYFTVFNLADAMIVAGVISLIIVFNNTNYKF